MLTITDKNGKPKLILEDEDTEPQTIKDYLKKKKKKKKKVKKEEAN